MKLDGIYIGDFDRKITIESETETINTTTSERIKTWSFHATAWANRLQDSKEGFEAQKQVSNNTSQWAIRHTAGVDETMRVNDHGTYHYIKGIRKVDRNNFLILMTEQRDG